MSLAEAITEIAGQMEDEAKQWDRDYQRVLNLFARMLRNVVKAVEGSPLTSPAPAMPAELQHAVMIDKARAEFRKGKQEEQESRLIQMIDGPLAGDYIPVAPDMPIAAKTSIAGHVYQLQADSKLHFVEPAPVK